MAYGDFTTFNPSEQAYKEPGQFEAASKAGALQKASYMSEMDKFYAQLGETQRQFDISAELERGTQALQGRGLDIQSAGLYEQSREFDLSFGLAEEAQDTKAAEFQQTFGLESARLLEEGRQFDQGMGLAQAQLALSQKLTEAQIEQIGAITGLTQARTKSTGLGDTLGILGLTLAGTNILFGEKNLNLDASDITGAGNTVWDALTGLGESGSEYDGILLNSDIDWGGIGKLTGIDELTGVDTDWENLGKIKWPWEKE